MNRKTPVIIGIVIGLPLGGLLAVFTAGALAPEEHSATVSSLIGAPPDQVFHLISTPAEYPTWRPEVLEVEMHTEEPLQFVEVTDYGAITFQEVERVSNTKLVLRIAEQDLGFGGQWTYEIAEADAGSTLTITEDGYVTNPLMRGFVLIRGYDATLKQFLQRVEERFQ